jgi:Conjugal transfer protein
MLRYNTVIRIPKGELVREASAGDGADLSKPGSGDWIIVASTDGDAVYAKPTRPGVATNLEIRTDHGNRYTFFLQDHSQDRGYRCHLEYIVNPTGQAILSAIQAPRKYVEASKYDEAREEADHYKRERDQIEAKWIEKYNDSQISGRMETLSGLTCDYDLKHSKVTEPPFNISNICHDKQFTYIWAKEATDHFGIEDYKQGSASLIVPDYDPKSGIYTVHHVIEHGRVQIGTGKKTKSADFQKGAA